MRLCLLIAGNLCAVLLFAQNYTYTHYNVKDRLAGSTVYDLCQDKEGFMWFATETGVSRFDSTHFRNYTMDDGLPANEILTLFADSRGRVWIGPFKKAICYYYNNKIFTPENDSLLQKIKPDGYVRRIVEDTDATC